MGRGFAYATADGVKFKVDDFESKFDHILFKDRTDLPDSVKKIGDRYPINADKAGKVYHINDLPDSIKAKLKAEIPDFDLKYPDGVRFDEYGFPDFGPYATHTVKLEKFSPGKHSIDGAKADIEVRKIYPNYVRPDGYTWHHHQDGSTMQLVPQSLHDTFKHTSGMAITKHKAKK